MRNQDQAIGPHWKQRGSAQNSSCNPGCLFDLKTDKAESVDLYHTRPDIVQQLMSRLAVVSKTAGRKRAMLSRFVVRSVSLT